MKIRKASQKDHKNLLELVMFNMKHHIRLNKQDWERIEKIRRLESKELKKSLKGLRTMIFVLEDNNKIVGYITISFHSKGQYTKTKKKASIDDLFVLKEYRKRGIGRALFNKTLKLFKLRGVKNISINVNSNNKIAIKAYEKFGFKENVKKMQLKLK